MVAALRELFAKSKHPSHEDKESAAHVLADIIQRAQVIGHEHATDELERSIAWGGRFTDALSSAWDIVSNFVSRIADWISEQVSGDTGAELSQDDVVAEVDSLASTVAGVEVAAAIEEEVMDTLQSQGFLQIQWYAQPDACATCKAKADMGAVPIGTDFGGVATPPAHSSCRCSIGTPNQ